MILYFFATNWNKATWVYFRDQSCPFVVNYCANNSHIKQFWAQAHWDPMLEYLFRVTFLNFQDNIVCLKSMTNRNMCCLPITCNTLWCYLHLFLIPCSLEDGHMTQPSNLETFCLRFGAWLLSLLLARLNHACSVEYLFRRQYCKQSLCFFMGICAMSFL